MKLSVYTLTVIYLLQSLAGAVPIFVENAPALERDIFIPESYGIIEKSSFDDYLSARLVILLKDAHCNYDAQHNIARILEVLVRDYKIDLVAVEGAAGSLDFARFWQLENEPAREKMADTFVKKGILSGPEYLTITKDGKLSFNIYGIENEKLYVENFTTFRQTIDHIEETELFINELSRIIKNLKQRIYPKELLDFDNKAAQYYDNTISLTDWVKELKKEVERLHLDLKEYPNISLTVDSIGLEEQVDFKKVEIERASAIGKLEKVLSREELNVMIENSLKFRLGKIASSDYYKFLEELLGPLSPDLNFPNLTRYIQLVKFQSWINNDNLFSEIENIEHKIKGSMFRDKIQRDLDDLSKRARILNNLFKLTLNRDDLGYYMGHKDEFLPDNLLSFINIQAPLHNIPMSMLLGNESFLNTVGRVISSGEKFYYIAVERDVSLVENTLRVMEEKKKSSAIMVIGGFHTDGVLNLFETKGIGYLVISPKIMRADKEGLYLSLMMDKRIQLAQKTSSLAFPKLMPDGDNVARLVVPMGAEGWRRELLDLALAAYQGILGKEVVGERPALPFIIDIKPDGAVALSRNPGYTDKKTPDIVLEWFRLGMEEVLGRREDLRGFVTRAGIAEKYLGRPAVVEYRLRTGHTVDEGVLRRATVGFIQFYLDLCRVYEEGGWLAVQQGLGTRWREFLPESIRIQEFGEGFREPKIKSDLMSALAGKEREPAVAEGIINYLLTMPAYGVDEKGNVYQTLFFSSYLGLAIDIFGLEQRGLLERLQSYRFLQVYLSRLYGVEKPEPVRDDELGAVLTAKKPTDAEKAKRVEILARYLSGEEFPEHKGELEKIVRRKLPEWSEMQWVKAAGGVTAVNEDVTGDPVKREVYVSALSRMDMTDVLDASDRYTKKREEFEKGLPAADEMLAELKNRTFIHDVSMYLGDVREVKAGYKYSDLGSPGTGLLGAIQRSKDNDQYFLYETDIQREAMKAYLKRYGIKAEERQFKRLGEYGDIQREGRVIISMVGDGLKEKVSAIKGDRMLIGNADGSDLMLMGRLALVVAGPEDIEKDRARVENELKDLFRRYYLGTMSEAELAELLKNISIADGIFRIILPPITPFVKEYYDTLIRARETISKAA